jgi:hypothetical protein
MAVSEWCQTLIIYLDDIEFLERVDRKINNETSRPHRVDFAEIEAVCRYLELSVNQLRSRSKDERPLDARAGDLLGARVGRHRT